MYPDQVVIEILVIVPTVDTIKMYQKAPTMLSCEVMVMEILEVSNLTLISRIEERSYTINICSGEPKPTG